LCEHRRQWSWARSPWSSRPRSRRPACGDEVDKRSSPGRSAAATRATSFVPSTSRSPAVVWAVGGGADGSDDARKVARRIGAGRVDRFLYLGDVYEDGTAAEYADHYRPIYGHLDKVTAPTPGNHEWPNHIEGYDPYWKKVRGKEPPSWHSFRVAGWKLLALNSEDSHDRGSAQVRCSDRSFERRAPAGLRSGIARATAWESTTTRRTCSRSGTRLRATPPSWSTATNTTCSGTSRSTA
jgi:hypothetical protein